MRENFGYRDTGSQSALGQMEAFRATQKTQSVLSNKMQSISKV